MFKKVFSALRLSVASTDKKMRAGFVNLKALLVGLFVAMFGLMTNASAAFVSPDFSASITDMGVAFAAVLTLVIAVLGFKYIRRLFA